MMAEASILSQMCNEGVYRKNAFHILGLPTDASAKTIRRRKEDFDSARELGEQSWKQEFPHWLSKSEVPTYQQVCDAFAFIEDPANRLVAEFFWVWPIEDSDAAVKNFLSGRRDEACAAWFSSAQKYGRRRAIAQHNLAVVNHALAIEGELALISGSGIAPDKANVEELWRKSFAYWEELADDDDFWEQYEKRMREFDDPRLTGGFIRRIRQEFPIAFDDINARIALLYAKQGKECDAKRHVEYMKKTMSAIDDVAQSFDTLFEPLEKQIERVINGCRARVDKDATQGASCVEEILMASADIVRAAEYLLDSTNGRRLRILSDIFEASNSFLVAFGNKTHKWDVCLELNKKLMPLACTKELQDRATSNQQIIQGNLDQQVEEHTCAGCGKKEGQKRTFGSIVRVSKQNVKMYGNIRRNYESFGGVSYSTIEIDVPCCDKCKHLTTMQLLQSKHLARAIKEGFLIGEKPSQADMRKAWGLPGTEQALPSRSVGCVIPIVVGFLVVLAGCALAGCAF